MVYFERFGSVSVNVDKHSGGMQGSVTVDKYGEGMQGRGDQEAELIIRNGQKA